MQTDLEKRYDLINNRIEKACLSCGRKRSSVTLIAVTKTQPISKIQQLIDLGVTQIGENRVQEIIEKIPELHGNFTLHMIGHLQTNKVAPVLAHAGWIQSVDRENLIRRIESLYKGNGKINVLVEVNTSGEESKSGCKPDDCRKICELVVSSGCLELRGLMTIGPLGANEVNTRKSFSMLRKLADSNQDLAGNMELSMGMSGDFEWAIEDGSTMVRIGSMLLGERDI
jgi:PLP dependent protein